MHPKQAEFGVAETVAPRAVLFSTEAIVSNSHPFTSWTETVYEPNVKLEKEFERIEIYSKMGHLATYEQAIEYQKWKETKNIQK